MCCCWRAICGNENTKTGAGTGIGWTLTLVAFGTTQNRPVRPVSPGSGKTSKPHGGLDSTKTWIARLGRSFLIEWRAAYKVFNSTSSPPRMVVAIGDSDKRRFLQHAFRMPVGPSGGIALRPLMPSTIIADCDVQNLPELLPIDPMRPTGDRNHHAVEHFPPEMQPFQIVQLAQEFYWHTLAPFSCLFLLFARDFRGLDPSSTSSAHGPAARWRTRWRPRLEFSSCAMK